MAWLINQSMPVTNVFTSSYVEVTVAESDTDDGDEDPTTNRYTMLPGATITKDPVVTFASGSEDAWLFVKLDQTENFDSFLNDDMADGWSALSTDGSVFWRKAAKMDFPPQTFCVIKGNKVKVKENVTAYMLNTLTLQTQPALTVTAYAVQQYGVESAETPKPQAVQPNMTQQPVQQEYAPAGMGQQPYYGNQPQYPQGFVQQPQFQPQFQQQFPQQPAYQQPSYQPQFQQPQYQQPQYQQPQFQQPQYQQQFQQLQCQQPQYQQPQFQQNVPVQQPAPMAAQSQQSAPQGYPTMFNQPQQNAPRRRSQRNNG